MTPAHPAADTRVRRLAREDLDAVVAVDAAILGRTRRAYFERRLAAALRQPEAHVQFAIEADGAFRGHVLGRVVEGEFGRSKAVLRLEVISVSPAAASHGLGRTLHAAIEQEAAKRGVAELRTASSWRDHAMLRFLSAMGYSLAPAAIVERAVPATPAAPAARGAVEVRLLSMKDLADVARIDRNVTGRDRTEYMRRSLEEALRDSAIRVSLAARVEGAVAGFIMARADLGDFGRAEPVAIVDTLGVDPGARGRGIGRALLAQLFDTLSALRIERAETLLSLDALDLIGFFRRAGFEQGQRVGFCKPLQPAA